MSKNIGVTPKTRAFKGMAPYENVPLRVNPRINPPKIASEPFAHTGEPVFHNFPGPRHAFPLPVESKGPVRARTTRRKKIGDGY
jgi:hypothetical protein